MMLWSMRPQELLLTVMLAGSFKTEPEAPQSYQHHWRGHGWEVNSLEGRSGGVPTSNEMSQNPAASCVLDGGKERFSVV